MKFLKTLLNRYPGQTLGAALALGLALTWLWTFLHYTPDGSGAMKRARRRQATAAITTHQLAIAVDTPIANAAHLAAHQLLDTARQHARRATYYHQAVTLPTPRHAHKNSLPLTDPTAAEKLERQLADQLR